jgi:predicted nucleic-acid-binding protein
MKKYIIDTNCLISYVTDRDERQRASVSLYFDSALKSQCTLVVLTSVITEFVYVLSRVYQADPLTVCDMTRTILHTPGIEIDTAVDFESVISLWPEKIRDFGDAILASRAREINIPILTLDRSFIAQLKTCNIAPEEIPHG